MVHVGYQIEIQLCILSVNIIAQASSVAIQLKCTLSFMLHRLVRASTGSKERILLTVGHFNTTTFYLMKITLKSSYAPAL